MPMRQQTPFKYIIPGESNDRIVRQRARAILNTCPSSKKEILFFTITHKTKTLRKPSQGVK